MKNHEEKSDFEINKEVSGVVDFGEIVVTVNDSNETVYLCEKDGLWDILPISHFDPCNNPADAWPIIVDNKINIEWRDSVRLNPLAKGTGGSEYWHADKNPLRAAMICFLKMKDAE